MCLISPCPWEVIQIVLHSFSNHNAKTYTKINNNRKYQEHQFKSNNSYKTTTTKTKQQQQQHKQTTITRTSARTASTFQQHEKPQYLAHLLSPATFFQPRQPLLSLLRKKDFTKLFFSLHFKQIYSHLTNND